MANKTEKVINPLKAIYDKNSKVELILINGTKAYDLFMKNNKGIKIRIEKMPSTSPANAACHYDKLVSIWKEVIGDHIF